jgi:hypothetical protein
MRPKSTAEIYFEEIFTDEEIVYEPVFGEDVIVML